MPFSNAFRAALMATSAIAVCYANPALAQEREFNVPEQSAASGIVAFANQADLQILVKEPDLRGRSTRAVQGAMSTQDGLRLLLADTGLHIVADDGRTVTVSADPQSGSVGGDGADQGTVAALIVTAQKREEQIQDVPIAISAFTEKSLQEQKIEGGFDLLKAIPNVTFSKNNFTSYNFSIRGVGTKAVSATTDPGVAVSFNNIALLQNRLFEQEYFDVERVEVLRGPQGTLYGRNATAGVINVISAKPNLQEFSGWLKGEVGNYHAKRVSAMINIPLVQDKLAIRIAGALTDRQGYDYNTVTKNAVNGRDLWSGRITVAFNPTDRFRSNLVWERFNEDDNRSRTGKQLCHRDQGPTEVGGYSLTDALVRDGYAPNTQLFNEEYLITQGIFSQGCKPGNLYDQAAFGTPNGLANNIVLPILALRVEGLPYASTGIGHPPGGFGPRDQVAILQARDPYADVHQSTDLREIASLKDPTYRASADVVELNMEFELTPALTIYSQTAYDKDSTYSAQDFNRFNTGDVFTDTSSLEPNFGDFRQLAPGGVFCDPQLGCSKTMVGYDIAKAEATQFTQEFRIQSSFDGPVNFSAGANYTHFKALVDYYVFFNVLSALAESMPFNDPGGPFLPGTYTQAAGSYVPDMCASSNFWLGTTGPNHDPVFNAVSTSDPNSPCPYIDPNSLESINGEGHNYFRSKNPYKLRSWAGFGELYWQMTDRLKLTAGLRYTRDEKTFIPVPSQVLLAPSFVAGGAVPRGYPELPAIKQKWGEWTGRIGVDYKADLGFTDQTLLYSFFSRGYKGGGANPPKPGFATADQINAIQAAQGIPQDQMDTFNDLNLWPVLKLSAAEYGDTFKPEFVNAFEVGAKNTLLGGAMTLNLTGFFYDYKDYQVSQIRDRTAVNENFDAKTWGLEFETMFAPSRDLQFIANVGYLDTEIADGEKSIDIMNRTQDDPRFTLVKPWPQLPSNCVIPTAVATWWLQNAILPNSFYKLCGMGGILGYFGVFNPIRDPNFSNASYDPTNYPEINEGAGIYANLGGNELPNAPHWTANLGAQYGHDILDGSWRATVRADAYWQSQSWARVYNDNPYDKLHGWYNVNLSVWLEKPEQDLKIELYAKNLLDKTPITDAFLNSDDTALTTNVFVLDPRLIGLSIRKGF